VRLPALGGAVRAMDRSGQEDRQDARVDALDPRELTKRERTQTRDTRVRDTRGNVNPLWERMPHARFCVGA